MNKQCPLCFNYFGEGELQEHVALHHGDFLCNSCLATGTVRVFTDEQSFINHIIAPENIETHDRDAASMAMALMTVDTLEELGLVE